jgi:hypothetical protein
MFMPKEPLSVTLDIDNLIWLRGRVASRKRRSLSDALDEIVTAARTGARGTEASRSVVGTIDLAPDDPGLDRADAYIREHIEASIARPLVVDEEKSTYAAGRSTTRKTIGQSRKRSRG